MPTARSLIAGFAYVAGRCALAGAACALLTIAAVAQGGTVAVTGDGDATAATAKPSVGDTIPDDAISAPGKQQKRKKSLDAASG